ncbi:MAG: single-stranded-DNA-specific exonuclease RecJ [Treponema sp.]|jgi:single-stranded-DNA-specific exonuclease|nr:single-stranded-DNA-specific exonuclease RecJ [Treponema sp.]
MKWKKEDISPEQVKNTAAKYGCDLLTASILARRGINSGEEIRYFLEDDPRHFRNPFLLPGMEDAVDRIIAAKEEGEKVLVFGDRDVDGITSTALTAGFLRSREMDLSWRLPMGDDAYGLSIKAVEEFAASGGTLIITVDCGISNVREVKRAGELGVDVIVTDHHNPQDELPPALAIVNPKLKESNYPFRDLAGCGVAYKLVSALRFAFKSEYYNQPVCLLNTRPLNDAWIIETVKMRNLAVVSTLTETVVPGMVGIEDTRLPAFLQGQQILVWDAPLQKRILGKIFGPGIEFGLLDLAPEIGKEIPRTAGQSLLRIKELSKIAKYSGGESGELGVFINLFTSFVQSREKLFSAEDEKDLQLVCLGTIADIMPLVDENRIIVRKGIKSLEREARPGLSNLLSRLELSGAGRRLGSQDLSWQLCPAINAAGRMGNPEKAVSLLLENDPARRDALAKELMDMNERRKKIGEENWLLVESQAGENLKDYGGKLALAYGEAIFRGVTGILANRLVGRYKVPSIVVSFGGGIATGSLRSIRGYDLRFLIEPCADLFIDWGGHDYAMGFSIDIKTGLETWNEFLGRLKTLSASVELEAGEDEGIVTVDAELPLPYLVPEKIFETVDRFEPYGEKNGPLVFLAKGIKVADLNLIGKPEAKHVKLTLDAGKTRWPALYWQAAERVRRDFDLGDDIDLVFTLNRNWFNGQETPRMIVTDLRRSQ